MSTTHITPLITYSFLSLSLLVLFFLISLMIVIGASAWFTRRLEILSDLFDLSPGLLSLLGALGANVPNYVASLFAAASGHLLVGLGIIIGSNIYNIAIILGISTFASKARHGITLTQKAARDVSVVAMYALVIVGTTWLAVILLSQSGGAASHVSSNVLTILLIVTNLLSLGFLCALALHALHRVPHEYPSKDTPASLIEEAVPLPLRKRWRVALRPLGK